MKRLSFVEASKTLIREVHPEEDMSGMEKDIILVDGKEYVSTVYTIAVEAMEKVFTHNGVCDNQKERCVHIIAKALMCRNDPQLREWVRDNWWHLSAYINSRVRIIM